MMGDVGANVLGAVAGLALITVLAPWARLAVVVALAAIHIIGERVSLSDIIPRSRVAAYLDRLGTEHLPELPTGGVGQS
jgi:UDP-N-acetylmuramyl pentapeptide phosphotransferase/UDP-N-acetylglucosamine-1-phosphate transferase